MGLMSPTVIRVTAIVLVAGIITFIVAGFGSQGEEQSNGNVLLSAVVIGGPISAIIGVVAGIFWEKLLGPIKSVEHLDMRKKSYKSGRQRNQPARSDDAEGDPGQTEDYALTPCDFSNSPIIPKPICSEEFSKETISKAGSS